MGGLKTAEEVVKVAHELIVTADPNATSRLTARSTFGEPFTVVASQHTTRLTFLSIPPGANNTTAILDAAKVKWFRVTKAILVMLPCSLTHSFTYTHTHNTHTHTHTLIHMHTHTHTHTLVSLSLLVSSFVFNFSMSEFDMMIRIRNSSLFFFL